MSVGAEFLMRLGSRWFVKQVSMEGEYRFFAYLAGICQIETIVADGGFGEGLKRKFGVARVVRA